MEQSHQTPQEIAQMLREWSDGKQEAIDTLLPLIMPNFITKPRVICAVNVPDIFCKRLFDAVVELAATELKRFLDKSRGTDDALRRVVEKLLSSFEDAESFMEQPAAEVDSILIRAEPENFEAGKCFGHYEIIRQIGAGGMGEVYFANDKKLERRVAAKFSTKNSAATNQISIGLFKKQKRLPL